MQIQHSLGFPKLLSLSLNMKMSHTEKKKKHHAVPPLKQGENKSIWSFAQNIFKEKIFPHEILIQTSLGEKMAIVLDSNKSLRPLSSPIKIEDNSTHLAKWRWLPNNLGKCLAQRLTQGAHDFLPSPCVAPQRILTLNKFTSQIQSITKWPCSE